MHQNVSGWIRPGLDRIVKQEHYSSFRKDATPLCVGGRKKKGWRSVIYLTTAFTAKRSNWMIELAKGTHL